MPNFDSHSRAANCSRRLALRLRDLRRRLDLTQEEVAKRAKISTYTYQKYEKGESRPGTPMNPEFSTLVALAVALEVSISELLDIEVDYDGYEPQDPDDE